MVDAVVLDWEGVLADTGAARRHALACALADEGLRADDAMLASCSDSMSLHSAIASVLRDARPADATLADLLVLRASRAFAERLGKGFVLAPGAREFVEGVEVHAPVAIVTSATRSETEFVLRLAGLDSGISTIVSADDFTQTKTGAAHREAVARLARRRAVSASRVVALACVAETLDGARRAGVRTIAVGAAAHVALHADGAVDSVQGLAVADLARLAGIAAAEHRS